MQLHAKRCVKLVVPPLINHFPNSVMATHVPNMLYWK